MNWFERWIARRQVKDLKEKIQKIQEQAQASEDDRLILSACTVTHRVRLLEQAVEKIETRQAADMAVRR